ncbi:MAG: prephenate dehydrogenase [Methanosphaera stadtmanae]|nr:prephenate dehydrogenase [Methanosphaera stadtmanae]
MTCENIKNVTIIGGTRGLGKWIANELIKEEFNVTITSRNKTSGEKIAKKINAQYSNDNIEAIENADLIIFSVPIENMTETIKDVAPYAPENSLLMDITSVKKEPSETLLKYSPKNTEILPCHPMFGPRVPSIEGQVIILTPDKDRSNKSFEIIKSFLEKKNAHVVVSTPEEHDKIMSVVQGITHFSYISIASTIKKLNISVKKSREFASPIYSLMLDMISRIVSQNPYLYYSIQKSNNETAISRKTFIDECIYLSKLIENGNEELFVENMSDSAKHLDEFEEALGRSDKAISILTNDLNVLKESIGKEIGVEHQYSKNVHIGVVDSVTADTVTLITDKNEKISLKISNINKLSDEELFNWKKNNSVLNEFDVSVIFPDRCNKNILLNMFKNIKPVINVELMDVYTGPQIKENYVSLTFHYSTFNKYDQNYVENYLKGIGGIIR